MSKIHPRAIAVASRRRVRRSPIGQICLIFALWWGSVGAVHLFSLPIPSGILGLAFAFILLATHRVSLFTLRRGAEWFVGDMMLFFVPAVVSVIDHPEFIGRLGLELLAVIVLSTLAVMTMTAMTVELMYRRRIGRDQSQHNSR